MEGTVENLTLVGSADLTGAGNAAGNTLTGNAGANALYGRDGNDIWSEAKVQTPWTAETAIDTLYVGESY